MIFTYLFIYFNDRGAPNLNKNVVNGDVNNWTATVRLPLYSEVGTSHTRPSEFDVHFS